jgi:uncharacterized protein YecE (DUF72 family)
MAGLRAAGSIPQAFIGTSGYIYPRWRGQFYPADLPQRAWLTHASRHFNSIELNGTFYSLKSPEVYARWARETPDSFIFAIKGSRFITHNKKLARVDGALANFFASGILELGRKTGPFLWQLPATSPFDRDRVDAFLRLLPVDSSAASRLAAKHDPTIVPRATATSPTHVRYRHALEPRHPSYFTEECYALLRNHGVALVIADTGGKFPVAHELTAPFVYVRLHGSEALYASRYSDHELDHWADQLVRWSDSSEGSPRDLYVYFDNDAWGHAPFDAMRLAERMEDRGLKTGSVTG